MSGNRQQGFTILEVLVAFLLATLLLAVILSGFSTGLSGFTRLEKMAQAALIAQTRMAEVAVLYPLEEAEYEGQTEDSEVGFRWKVRIRPFSWGYAAELEDRQQQMFMVEVAVSWPAVVGEHDYQLASLRLASRGAQ